MSEFGKLIVNLGTRMMIYQSIEKSIQAGEEGLEERLENQQKRVRLAEEKIEAFARDNGISKTEVDEMKSMLLPFFVRE